jgi:ABC-type nitrate/sulfonate/bicarbonate transport system substrate-binding protein
VKIRRISFAAFAFVALAAATVACGSDGPERAADGRRKVTVVLDWTPNTNHSGLYLAEAEGWYREAGLDVDIIQPGDAGSLQLLGVGKADFAVSVQEEVIPARAEGVPVVSIAAIIEHNTSSLLSLASEGITRPADLEGRRYGGFGGALEEALLAEMIRCDGGDPSKLDFVEVGEADYRVGLDRGDYDAVWIFDGWDKIRLAELEGVDVNTIPFTDYTECIPDWYTPVLTTNEDMIEGDPETVEAFMEATTRGYRKAMEDPASAAETLLEAAPELDAELVERSARYLAERYAEVPERWGRQERDRWERFVAFLVDAGLIDEPIDADAAFTNRFLPDGSGS